MPGRLITQHWQRDAAIDAPARYNRDCDYDAFVPDELSSLVVRLDGHIAGLVSEAEHWIRQLNNDIGPASDPLARLMLRTESIASSKIEGLQLGLQDLARAEALAD